MRLVSRSNSSVMTFSYRLILRDSRALKGWEPGALIKVIQMSCEAHSGSQLTKTRKPLNTRARMATVGNSERSFFFEKQMRFPLLKLIVDFDFAEAPREKVWDSHKADTVLLPLGL